MYIKPEGFAEKLIHLLYDEDIWIGDQTKGFAGTEYYVHRTKCFADWPIEVQSVLLTRQLFMNTADW